MPKVQGNNKKGSPKRKFNSLHWTAHIHIIAHIKRKLENVWPICQHLLFMSFVTHKQSEKIKLEVRVLSHFVVNSQARVGFVEKHKTNPILQNIWFFENANGKRKWVLQSIKIHSSCSTWWHNFKSKNRLRFAQEKKTIKLQWKKNSI